MESSRSKVEVVKPVFLIAGFHLAALILAKITARKSPYPKPSPPDVQVNSVERSSPENDFDEVYEDEGSFRGHDPTTFFSLEDGNTLTSTQMRDSCEHEILGLRSMIKELQEREWEVEAQFLRYQDLKEQEFVLNEFQTLLLLELARVEFMDREVSSMEAENKRFNDMVIDYLRTLEELKSSKLENGMLQRKVKKLLKRVKERSRVISEQNLLIQAKEAVISRNGVDLETEADTIKGLKDEIEELQTVIRRLQEEKNELLEKLEMAENSASLKNEAKSETTDDYNQVVNELEQLQKDRGVEVKELINLRWHNACLRHELLKRSNQEQDGNLGLIKNNERSGINVDFGGSAEMGRFISLESGSNSSILTQSDQSSMGLNKGDHRGESHSKSRSLYWKLKKWMDASDKRVKKHKPEEKKKPELKFFGSHSVADVGEETHFPTRM